MSAGQRERIAVLNDRARQAMGLTCTAVATIGFRSLPEADQSRVRELIEPTVAGRDQADHIFSYRLGRYIFQVNRH